jgi:hypothetical protein
MQNNLYYKKLLIDCLIILGLTFAAGFFVGLFAAIINGEATTPAQMLIMIGLINIVFITVGFVIVGARTSTQRLKHLSIVGFIVWLISAFNMLMAEGTLQRWLLSLPLIMILMLVGFGISCLIKPQETNNP